jgi:uncharacterized protein YndB with AHSA1/START domain
MTSNYERDSNPQGGTETTLSPLGQAALQYAAQGIQVFPCVPGGKAPLHFLGNEKASTEPEQIRAWWQECPDANIGGVMGDHLIAVDVAAQMPEIADDPKCPDLAERVEQAREEFIEQLNAETTQKHSSPRSSTHHLFSSLEPAGTFHDRAEPIPGIRIRHKRGYLILPESVLDGIGIYTTSCAAEIAPLPEWLAADLRDLCPEEPNTDHPLSFEDWRNQPPAKMVVDKLVPDEKLIFAWGHTGNGKTYYIADIAASIAWRVPVLGQFEVKLPGRGGVVVIFAAEDTKELVMSRLTALAIKHNRSIEGHIFVSSIALPVGEDKAVLRQACFDEVRRIQAITGKKIDALFNDTTGRSVGTDNINDAPVAQNFCDVANEAIREFHCPFISTAHDPKAGGSIAGSQVFENNASVAAFIEGEFDENRRLLGFQVTFTPKYRCGPTPDAFYVKAETVTLPWEVNGVNTDVVFRVADGSARRGKPVENSDKEMWDCVKVLAKVPEGLQRSEWQRSCTGVKPGNFKNRLDQAVKRGLVLPPERQRQPYRVASGAMDQCPRGRTVGDLYDQPTQPTYH